MHDFADLNSPLYAKTCTCAANKVGIFSETVFWEGLRDRTELVPLRNVTLGGMF